MKMKNAVASELFTSRMTAHASHWRSGATARASKRPSTGAVMAWVSGTPKRAGPMIATLSSIAARLAPKPWRSPRRSRHARQRHAAGQRHPEASGGRGPGGQEGDGGHVRGAGGRRAHPVEASEYLSRACRRASACSTIGSG